MSIPSEIAKAGWLYRQSSVLHRWKKNWFVLYRDGLLRYFESQESPRAEEVFVLRNVCMRIKVGPEVRPTAPPEEVGFGKMCMFELEMRDGNHLLLCAESADDMRAWQYTLEEARASPALAAPVGAVGYMPSFAPVGYPYHQVSYGGYPGQVISPAPPQVVHTATGTTTIINQAPPTQVVYVDDHPYRRRRHYGGTGTVYVTTPRYW